MASADLYAVLEVERDASPDDLKRAYRRLARQYHPDANPGDPAAEARFKEVSQAYEILSDPERRANYDRFGSDVGAQNPFGAGSVQDIFDMFFGGLGGRPQRRGPQPGPDAEATVDISLDDAAFGASREVTVTLPQRCATCSGSGCAPGTSPVACPECEGTGEVRRVRNSILGQMVTAMPCSRCGATGQRIESPCATCRGDGRVTATSTFSVQIPPGVEDGSTMRLGDRGPAGPRGGPPGRLFVHLRVTPDPRFERVGDDLHHEAHVSFAQAALGTTIEVPTLRESTTIDVEPGSAYGTVHRVRHEGVPHLHGRGRGDLFVHLVVDVPTDLDETSTDLLRQLAAHRGEAVREHASRLFSRRGAKK
ncbi:MAG: J domain-containing protein [Acidobacteriota bacterium]|nr:J domain-containing protein [Acidobacteriota bacterium]